MERRGSVLRRRSSNLYYHTFPTMPPKSRGRPPPSDTSGRRPGECDPARHNTEQECPNPNHQTPLPKKQLFILAMIALAEQTALNSISPYLPEMALTFPEVDPGRVGLYVGIIASCYAAAQVTSNFAWGWLSDRIGRKPVIIIGTTLTTVSFLAFGFSKTLLQAILVQVFLGLVNGDQGIVSSCLGEITDRSNQSVAFMYLPILYGLGGITGPLVGGTLAGRSIFNDRVAKDYPYLLPNLVVSAVLVLDLIMIIFFFEETLEDAPGIHKSAKKALDHVRRPGRFFALVRDGFDRVVSRKPKKDVAADPLLRQYSSNSVASRASSKGYLNINIILILATYLVFQLSNIAFNALFPIFSSASTPTGRNLSPEEIGLSQSFAGIVGIVFQAFLFGPFRERFGNKRTYRTAFIAFMVAFAAMPFVGYKDSRPFFGIGSGKTWLWVEVGLVLLLKTLATVSGLTTALLLITNSASSHSVLGRLNGLAQTLASTGGAIGPFVSGGLFSLAVGLKHKGEALAWGVFGGIAFLGFLLSLFIKGDHLEADDWHGDDESETVYESGGEDETA